jgi:hypothetical protein
MFILAKKKSGIWHQVSSKACVLSGLMLDESQKTCAGNQMCAPASSENPFK